MNHTPAPWTYDDTWGLIKAKDGTEIAACHSGIKANSRLIAAAPLMFEALQLAEDELSDTQTQSGFRALSAIRVALTKAQVNI